MTADHWNFVLAAYGLAALVFGLYWRHLCRRDRDLTAQMETTGSKMDGSKMVEPKMVNRNEERSEVAPGAGHPRSKPASRTPRQ